MSEWGTGNWGEAYGGGDAQLPPPVTTAVDNWGAGWGTSLYGAASPGSEGESPTVLLTGPRADVVGGTILAIFGEHFAHPTTFEFIDMTGGDEVVGYGYYARPEMDLRPKKALIAAPALPLSTYGIRVVPPFGTSAILRDAVTYEDFADEMKVERVKRRFAAAWATGERILQ